jgi:hypothetical protein
MRPKNLKSAEKISDVKVSKKVKKEILRKVAEGEKLSREEKKVLKTLDAYQEKIATEDATPKKKTVKIKKAEKVIEEPKRKARTVKEAKAEKIVTEEIPKVRKIKKIVEEKPCPCGKPKKEEKENTAKEKITARVKALQVIIENATQEISKLAKAIKKL